MTMNGPNNIVRYPVAEHVKMQFFHKMRVHARVFSGLVLFQGLFILLGILSHEHSIGMGMDDYSLNIDIYNSDNVIAGTMIWAFIVGCILASKQSRKIKDVFITNNVSNHLANIGCIIVMSLTAAVTAFLANYFIKIGVILVKGMEQVHFIGAMTMQQTMIGLIITCLYLLLVFSIGYCIGLFFSMNKGLAISAVIVVLFATNIPEFEGFINDFGQFYLGEANVMLFGMKVVVTCFLLYSVTIFCNKRLEGR